MRSHIQFGSKRIDFKINFANRKTLGITVTPEMQVLVDAPLETNMELIHAKLRKKAAWIIKQQSYFLSYLPKTPVKKFVSGETHLYLGRQYRLKVIQDPIETVKLSGKLLVVRTTKQASVKKLLEAWYKEKSNIRFKEIAQPLIERFRKYHVAPESIQIKEMSKRWGSCTPKGKIILNPELIKAPKGCIEYVIIHELCHLVHHNHTQKFLDLQTKEMKDWEKWKERLERLLA